MKMKILVPAALLLSLLAGGCAASRPIAPTLGGEDVPVEIRVTSPVTVSQAQAIRQDGKVLVSGTLERSVRIRRPGHVDVLFLMPDGSPIAEKQIWVAGLRSKRHGKQEVQFRASLDLELPEGASAIFVYHAPPREQQSKQLEEWKRTAEVLYPDVKRTNGEDKAANPAVNS